MAAGREIKKEIKIGDYERITIFFNTKNSILIDEDITNEESGIKTIRIIRISVNKSNYIVEFSEGGSYDPQFNFYKETENQDIFIGRIFCLELRVSSEGSIYCSGHTNSMFNMKRKFNIRKDNLVEVVQPFYHVGIKSNAVKKIELFDDFDMKRSIGVIPSGSQVMVIVNSKSDYYLVQDKYGITGWIKIPFGERKSKIEDIFFTGD